MFAPRLALLSVSGVVVAAGLSGCAQQGGVEDKDFSGEAARVANVVRELDDAYADEQNDDSGAATACRNLLSARLVASLGGRDCARNAAAALKNSDATQMDVRKVTIRGNVATVEARLKLGDDQQRLDTLTLVQEGRSWKFDGSATGKRGEKAAPAAPATAAPTSTTAAPTPSS
ncbi:hypothetical protein [Patulibacter sp.]|uniref:hypothetical protein n=1 Tax=Patulibacter sp. TaxID=1912859 RepID=UPI00271D276F|nr:hypothetical protein [Patulibacter sp.]MDO9407112.1 hypothetical protein [Patulibacter sp.]